MITTAPIQHSQTPIFVHGADPQVEPEVHRVGAQVELRAELDAAGDLFASYWPYRASATQPGASDKPASERSSNQEYQPVHMNTGLLDILRKAESAVRSWLMYSPPAGIEAYEPAQTHYVKMDVWVGLSGYGRCHGALIGDNMILTAAHCLPRDWERIIVHYGRGFQNTVTIIRNDKQPNWARIRDANAIEPAARPDLALVLLPASVKAEHGAIPTAISDQRPCEENLGNAQAYRSVGMSSGQMGIHYLSISRLGLVRNWGHMLRSEGLALQLGDSGSPLMSPTGEQIGVTAGYSTTPTGDVTHFVALCAYADAIKAHVRELNGTAARRKHQI